MDIFQAITQQNLDQIAQLLLNGTNPNIVSSDFPQWTPLHEAIEQLEYGSKVEVTDKFTAYRRLPPRNEVKDDAVWLAAEALLKGNFL